MRASKKYESICVCNLNTHFAGVLLWGRACRVRQSSEPVEGSYKGPLSCASKQETAVHSHSFTWFRLPLSTLLFQLYCSVTYQRHCISAAVSQHAPHIISCETMPRGPPYSPPVFPPAAPRLASLLDHVWEGAGFLWCTGSLGSSPVWGWLLIQPLCHHCSPN